MLNLPNLIRSSTTFSSLFTFRMANPSKISNITRLFSSKLKETPVFPRTRCFNFNRLGRAQITLQQSDLSLRRGISNYPSPDFWRGYPGLTEDQQLHIKNLECEVLNPAEVSAALKKAQVAADEQLGRYEKFKVAVTETDNIFLRIFDKFLVCFSEPNFQDLRVTEKKIEKLNIELKLIDHPLAAIAYFKGKRSYMEDTFVASEFTVIVGKQKKSVALSGVFDGHGGKECANFVSENIERILKQQLELFNNDDLTDAGIWNALTMSFVYLGQAFRSDSSHDFNPNAGTTANIALKIDNNLWMANSGDARAIVVDHDGNIIATNESAYLTDVECRNRVLERFGTIKYDLNLIPRIHGHLAVGGAIGNFWANGAVSARPSIVKLAGKNLRNTTIIQCTDGVWDVAPPHQVAMRFIKLKDNGAPFAEIAENIAAASSVNGSYDNITVLIQPAEIIH